MRPTFKPLLCALLSATVLASAPTQARSFLQAVVDTTPAGFAYETQPESRGTLGFIDATVEGTKQIFAQGNSAILFPTYTNHPKWAWDNRSEENAHPFGGGLARRVIDGRGNERTLYLLSFIDSNYRMEPAVGYQWQARFPIGQSGLHVGAGYQFGLTARADYMWLPAPLPLPVVSVGTENLSVYGTYIPFTNVMFFYTMFTIDDARRRDDPLTAASAWHNKQNFVYAGAGWTYLDSGAEEYTKTWAKNDKSYNAGWRHYSGRHWATDLSYTKGDHDISTPHGSHSYTIETTALQIQYNMDAADDLRLYAGAGFGYSRMKGPKNSDSDVHPVTSIGATYAVTNNLFVNADMKVSFSRFKHVVEDDANPLFLSAPTNFSLTMGYAF